MRWFEPECRERHRTERGLVTSPVGENALGVDRDMDDAARSSLCV